MLDRRELPGWACGSRGMGPLLEEQNVSRKLGNIDAVC